MVVFFICKKTFTAIGAEMRQEYIAEIKTNTGSNDKLPVIKYRDYAKAVIMAAFCHAKNTQMEDIQWQTLKQKNRKYRK